jgi:hypothetical protein
MPTGDAFIETYYRPALVSEETKAGDKGGANTAIGPSTSEEG